MIKLNLETKNEAEIRIKEYLENNVSEILAEKINKGVHLTKEDKILINKKTLSGFMMFANGEARELAEKGANFACIEDKTVYGWAIHYFEEESIEEKLYNEDGTEYKVEIKTTSKPAPKIEKPKKKENNQQTLFDLMNFCDDEPEKEKSEPAKEELKEPPIEYDEIEDKDNDIDDFTEEEIEQALDEIDKELVQVNNQVVNTTTGEVIEPTTNKISSIDKELAIMLYTLLEGNLEVK